MNLIYQQAEDITHSLVGKTVEHVQQSENSVIINFDDGAAVVIAGVECNTSGTISVKVRQAKSHIACTLEGLSAEQLAQFIEWAGSGQHSVNPMQIRRWREENRI